jgi:hypothetical protein
MKAKNISVTDEETIIKAARESVLEVRNSLIEGQAGCISSENGWKRFFRAECNFKLMIAYFFND